MDRISLDVDSLKLRSIPPKHDINESLKAMRISIDECNERTARMRASKDAFIKACSSNSYENQDEDLEVIDVSPIKSLFCNMNLDESEYDLPLPRRRSKNSEFLDLDDEIDESGIERNKNLDVAKPTILDFKEFNYESCSLIDCISLLQSMINSPHAYEQNKAFTKHIVDAMMKAFEEKLELEVSIPRKLHDEWEPTIKVKIRNYECFALSDLGASVSTIPKSLCDVLGLTNLEECFF